METTIRSPMITREQARTCAALLARRLRENASLLEVDADAPMQFEALKPWSPDEDAIDGEPE